MVPQTLNTEFLERRVISLNRKRNHDSYSKDIVVICCHYDCRVFCPFRCCAKFAVDLLHMSPGASNAAPEPANSKPKPERLNRGPPKPTLKSPASPSPRKQACHLLPGDSSNTGLYTLLGVGLKGFRCIALRNFLKSSVGLPFRGSELDPGTTMD